MMSQVPSRPMSLDDKIEAFRRRKALSVLFLYETILIARMPDPSNAVTGFRRRLMVAD
jgi:hypothetical protein